MLVLRVLRRWKTLDDNEQTTASVQLHGRFGPVGGDAVPRIFAWHHSSSFTHVAEGGTSPSPGTPTSCHSATIPGPRAVPAPARRWTIFGATARCCQAERIRAPFMPRYFAPLWAGLDMSACLKVRFQVSRPFGGRSRNSRRVEPSIHEAEFPRAWSPSAVPRRRTDAASAGAHHFPARSSAT